MAALTVTFPPVPEPIAEIARSWVRGVMPR